VDAAGIVPPVQPTTLPESTEQVKPPSVSQLSKMTPGAS
jgi:hypothetical protein